MSGKESDLLIPHRRDRDNSMASLLPYVGVDEVRDVVGLGKSLAAEFMGTMFLVRFAAELSSCFSPQLKVVVVLFASIIIIIIDVVVVVVVVVVVCCCYYCCCCCCGCCCFNFITGLFFITFIRKIVEKS